MFNMEIRKASVLRTMLLTVTFILMLMNFIVAHEIYAGPQTERSPLTGEEFLSQLPEWRRMEEGEYRQIEGVVELDTHYASPFFRVDGVALLNGKIEIMEPKGFNGSKEDEKRLIGYWEDGNLQSSTSMDFAERYKGKTVVVTGTHRVASTGSKPQGDGDGRWISNDMALMFPGIVVETIEILDDENLNEKPDRVFEDSLPDQEDSDDGGNSEEVPGEEDDASEILDDIENILSDPPVSEEDNDSHEETSIDETGGNSQIDESSGSNSSLSGIMAFFLTFISSILALFRFNS